MNNIMDIIKNKKYRVVVNCNNNKNIFSCNVIYKVQVKIFLFWINIKTFEKGIYDDDAEFCKNEAIELYNKIINPYGKL